MLTGRMLPGQVRTRWTASCSTSGRAGTGMPSTKRLGVPPTPRATARCVTYSGQGKYKPRLMVCAKAGIADADFLAKFNQFCVAQAGAALRRLGYE